MIPVDAFSLCHDAAGCGARRAGRARHRAIGHDGFFDPFMLIRRIDHAMKPYLPSRLRMGMRRMLARQRRRVTTDRWPIDPAASKRPSGWPGSSSGKIFAVASTHDVEGPGGLGRCRELAEREREIGFRSSFNLPREGPCKLEWTAARGGMVLLNVHADYLQCRGRGREPQRTVLEHYLDLLRFLETRFAGDCRHALPHRAAAFVPDRRFSWARHPERSS